MKKVLFITDVRHASTRIPGIIKFIKNFGYEPLLLSPSLETEFQYFGSKNYRIPPLLKRYLQKVYPLYQSVFHFPDEMKSEFAILKHYADELLSTQNIRAIISSSSPVSSHIISRELKEKYDIPWIADLRDLWSQNHNYPYGPLRKWRDTNLERTTLNSADVLVTVSEPLVVLLKERYPKKHIFLITNGFDPETRTPVKLTKKFTITYTGQIYEGKQDLDLFKRGLEDLLTSGSLSREDVEFRIYGPQGTLISKKDAIFRQRESQVLLLLNWLKNEGVYTLKVFEYLAAGRPILSVGGGGGDVVEELLRKTQSGVYSRNEAEIKNFLTQFYKEYKNEGHVRYYGIPEEIEKYSFVEISRQLAKVIDSLME
jgi:glycosyltransferase involved in cell wall biosynthesis